MLARCRSCSYGDVHCVPDRPRGHAGKVSISLEQPRVHRGPTHDARAGPPAVAALQGHRRGQGARPPGHDVRAAGQVHRLPQAGADAGAPGGRRLHLARADRHDRGARPLRPRPRRHARAVPLDADPRGGHRRDARPGLGAALGAPLRAAGARGRPHLPRRPRPHGDDRGARRLAGGAGGAPARAPRRPDARRHLLAQPDRRRRRGGLRAHRAARVAGSALAARPRGDALRRQARCCATRSRNSRRASRRCWSCSTSRTSTCRRPATCSASSESRVSQIHSAVRKKLRGMLGEHHDALDLLEA